MEKSIELANKLSSELKEIIIGRDDTIDLLITGLLAGGHVLIEDYPGSGKTTLTKSLGALIKKTDSVSAHINNFKRIQFTPDMLPGDVLGVTVFEPKTASFNFMPGPVFANIVLADEINRTGPKVQSAFLECMAEKQVTIDNKTHKLDDLFFVIGTQNPLDLAGTYPLPLVQRDRFLLKIPMNYVKKEAELNILNTHHKLVDKQKELKPIISRDEVLEAQKSVYDVEIHPDIVNAIVNIVQNSRNNSNLIHGASTRAAIMLQHALRSYALVKGRSYVISNDLNEIAEFVLLHRLQFKSQAGNPKDALKHLIAPELEVLIKKTI
jgi:MoxR-like ATPase